MQSTTSSPHFYTITLLLALLFLTIATAKVEDEWFEALDQNHDGLLDRDEYRIGIDKVKAFLNQPLPTATRNALLHLEGFWKAFSSAVAMIIATEIGDKTFFIAAVLSMKHNRGAVFTGAIAALILMTVLSTAMGMVLPRVLPPQYTHILSGLLFLYFGAKLIYDASKMKPGHVSDELGEVEEELFDDRKKGDEEQGVAVKRNNNNNNTHKHWYQVALQALTLTFLAEWGDRSQIATIALSASKNAVGVTVGGCLGHAFCTGIAVIGGRMLAARISERTVSMAGGCIFLVFAIHSLVFER